jgi:hypothetical protein
VSLSVGVRLPRRAVFDSNCPSQVGDRESRLRSRPDRAHSGHIVDNRRVAGASEPTDEADAQVRRLSYGRTFKIVKVYTSRRSSRLALPDWAGYVISAAETFFMFGTSARVA